MEIKRKRSWLADLESKRELLGEVQKTSKATRALSVPKLEGSIPIASKSVTPLTSRSITRTERTSRPGTRALISYPKRQASPRLFESIIAKDLKGPPVLRNVLPNSVRAKVCLPAITKARVATDVNYFFFQATEPSEPKHLEDEVSNELAMIRNRLKIPKEFEGLYRSFELPGCSTLETRAGALGACFEDKFFIFGGFGRKAYSEIVIVDSLTGSFEIKKTPYFSRNFQACVQLRNYLLLQGGEDSYSKTNSEENVIRLFDMR